jgi:hypothetical protein
MTNPEGIMRIPFVSALLFATTDEEGRYSLHVPPGEYFVVALPNNPATVAGGQPNRRGHRRTYFPHSADIDAAFEVTVGIGAPATADIQLIPAALMVLTGIVTNASGKPVPNARVALTYGDGLFGMAPRGFTARPNGTFALAGVAPGTYHLHYREGQWPPPLDVIPKVSVATVTVRNEDITGIRVSWLPMTRVTGRLVVAAPFRAQLLPETTVAGVPLDPDGNPGPTRPGTVRPDLTFELHAWPAVGTIRVSSGDHRWDVTRIRFNGVDVGLNIEFPVGRDLTGLEVEIAPRVPRR